MSIYPPGGISQYMLCITNPRGLRPRGFVIIHSLLPPLCASSLLCKNTTMIALFLQKRKRIIVGVLICISVCMTAAFFLARDGEKRFAALTSDIMYDRNGSPLSITANNKGLYAYPVETLNPDFVRLLIMKEDRFFYYHPGVNPFSTLRALLHYVRYGDAGGASTITQQLAKNILGTEGERTFKNKLKETLYAISLEIYTNKDEVLLMYANTVSLGNQVQGFEAGSRAYFDKSFQDTTVSEHVALLATLANPAKRNPWREENSAYARALYTHLKLPESYVAPRVTNAYTFQSPSIFEVSSLGIACTDSCNTTLDATVNEDLRTILAQHIARERARGARNGAIVVINPQTEELIALVGSPDPTQETNGGKINMALEPRPIGSTVKPFIYLKGFMEGLRPYSRVDDREYKYPIATGYALYPKNFDGQYHGEVTLHQALSNSLNVPSVKILEYIGLSHFYHFLGDTLSFTPLQPYDSYQYGIALGGLEMDLLTLTHYFTLFPRGGTLAPLITTRNGSTTRALPPQSHVRDLRTVADPKYIELVTAILSDRLTGVEQFGLKSSLNLTIPSYAVKTGTSRDFHDSWVVGYTPDFVVGVWLGNSENEPLMQVTGQSGAGTIWHDVMEYLKETPHYTGAQFTDTHITRIPLGNSLEWGLPGDEPNMHETLLLTDTLIVRPHHDDTFEFSDSVTIPLHASRSVQWAVNGTALDAGTEVAFHPSTPDTYELSAHDPESGRTEYITIRVITPSR